MSFNELEPEPSAPVAEGGAAVLNPQALLRSLRRHGWILVVTSLFALAIGIAYNNMAEPVYRSSGEIKVERRSERDDATEGAVVSLFENATAEDLKTIERVFLRPALIEQVIDALKLETRDNVVARGRSAKEVTRGDLIAYLTRQSQISLIPETRLIAVSFESWNPQLAQEIARSLVSQGIAFYRAQRNEAVSANIKNLRDESQRLRETLLTAESKLNDYLHKVGSVSVDQDFNLVALQLRQINSSLSTIKAERLKLESDFAQIEANQDDMEKLLAIQSVRSIPAVASLSSRAADLRGNYAKILERYGFKHPYRRQAESEMKMVEQSLREEVLKAPESLKSALNVTRRNEENLSEEQARLEQKLMQVKSQAAEFQIYQRQVEADRISYEDALKRLNQELAQGRIQPVLIQAVGEPGYGQRASLGPLRILGTSLVGGLMLGAGLIVLLAQMDRSLYTVEEIERALGLSVLASVPEVETEIPALRAASASGGESSLRRAAFPASERYDSPEAAAFQMLSAFLQPEESSGLGQAVLLTSAGAGEGKSFCALRLAVAQAQGGQRTLLVDASLAHPALEEWLPGRGDSPGLSDYLVGAVPFSSVILASPVPNLDVVAAGTSRSRFVEVFSRPRFRAFLEEARRLYDQVLFDSAPVASGGETLALARFFPVVCLVVEAGRTPRAAAQRAAELLIRAEAKPRGVIFNRLRIQSPDPGPEATAMEGAPGAEADEEICCAACGRRYASREACLRETVPCEEGGQDALPEGRFGLARWCGCGATLILPRSGLRDPSRGGQRRRDLFGELLDLLVSAGQPRETARATLLLTLKVWRNEIGEDPHRDPSQAGLRRRALLEEFLSQAEKAGMGRAEARAKLLEAAKSWREAP